VTRLAAVAAVLAAALGLAGAAAAFDNTEPDAAKEWYLTSDQAWNYWPTMPQLYPVKVAVVDSGIDRGHPEFAGKIAAGKSFVGTPWDVDTDGHGTFVAGEIAADATNGQGIAGLAFNAQLLIAKVVRSDGSVSLRSEVAAIHWAADQGAQVINLSLGGVRDPLNPREDSYSPLEQAAVDYAYAKGAVVVAAVGNGPQSPRTPWPFALYPAALPHVLGVSAIRRDGSVPAYSNRDPVYNDIAAPGDDMFSTVPRALSNVASCNDAGYSDCGPDELRNGIGTSFAAPQVSAGAALLLGENPKLTPQQVMWLLERSAVDETPADGCSTCAAGRDRFTGWGKLDITAALQALESHESLPPVDRYEPNDDAGPWAHGLPPLPRTVRATLDYWDDDVDVYRISLHTGQTLFAHLTAPPNVHVPLSLWKPGTQHVLGLHAPIGNRLAVSTRVGGQSRLRYTARVAGVYYLELKLLRPSRAIVGYRLALARK
jgi:subtilisin family serine protease